MEKTEKGGQSTVKLTFKDWSFSVKLDVNNTQKTTLTIFAGARRYAYNAAMAKISDCRAVWQEERAAGVSEKDRISVLTRQDLRNAWYIEKPDWYKSVPYAVIGYGMEDAERANKNFLRGLARAPKFAKKGAGRERFSVQGAHVNLASGMLRLPFIGWVRLHGQTERLSKIRRLLRKEQAKLTRTTVSRHADGSWWASVGVRQTVQQPRVHVYSNGPVVGVDRGIKTNAVAATSDTQVVASLASIRAYRDAQKKLARAQRVLSRRTRPGESSKNREKAKLRVGKLHDQIARTRAESLHVFSKSLVRNHAVIVLEDLNTTNMEKNKQFVKAMQDQAWYKLLVQLTYKAKWHGGYVLTAPQFLASSKTCASCKAVKTKLALSTRTYICGECGFRIDRDVNAAANLAAWGEVDVLFTARQQQIKPGPVPAPSGPVGVQPLACGGKRSEVAALAETSVLPREPRTSHPS